MDPFAGSFDEIYKQAGAENLVKKPMGAMAKQKPQTSPPTPASSQPAAVSASFLGQNVKSQPVSVPAFKESDLDDILGTGAKQPPANKSTSQQQLSTVADPFAAFRDVDGALPVMQASSVGPHVPASGFDEDDLLGLNSGPASSSSTPKPPPSAAPAAAPLPHHPPHPVSPVQPPLPSYNSDPCRDGHQSHGYRGFVDEHEPGPGLDTYSQAAAGSSSSSFDDTQDHYQHHPSYPARNPDLDRDPHSGSSSSSSLRHNQREYQYEQQRQFERSSLGSNHVQSPPPVQKHHHEGSKGGMANYLRNLSKRAIKTAQAGLQHLEAALEERREQQHMQQQHGGQLAQHTGPLSAHRPTLVPGVMPIPDRNHAQGSYDPAPVSPGHSSYSSIGGPQAHPFQGRRGGEEAHTVASTLMALPVEERDHVLSNLPYLLQLDVVRVMESMEGRYGQQGPGAPSKAAPATADIQTSSFDLDALAQADTHSILQGHTPPSSSVQAHGGRSAAAAATATTAGHFPAPSPPPKYANPSADLLGLRVEQGEDVHLVSTRLAAQQQHHHHMVEWQRLQQQQQQQCKLAQQHAQNHPQPRPAAAQAGLSPVLQEGLAPQQPQVQQQPRVASVEEADDFFSGGATSPAPQPTAFHPAAAAAAAAASSTAPSYNSVPTQRPPMPGLPAAATAEFYAAPPKPAQPPSGEDEEPAVDWAKLEQEDKAREHAQATQQQQRQPDREDEGEPEVRRQLRAARMAERQQKMDAALAEKQAKDEEEARKQAEQVQLKDQLKTRIEAWRSNKKGNIRAMLGSLEQVLWEGSGWNPVGMADLLETPQVKKAYMRANLLVHPDKVRQRSGTPEQVAIADMVFDVLKEAWLVFQK